MAFASVGTYPTPTPTDAQRAAYWASHGMLGSLPDYVAPEPEPTPEAPFYTGKIGTTIAAFGKLLPFRRKKKDEHIYFGDL